MIVLPIKMNSSDAHNMTYGDFNGDGFEDFVVAWAVFPIRSNKNKR